MKKVSIGTIINRALAPLGVYVGRVHRGPPAPIEYDYDFEADAMDAVRRVRSHTMLPHGVLISLWQHVRHLEVNRIPGAYVECGVWKGGAVGLMAQGNMRYSPARRELHLFDAFTDICEPDDAVDGTKALAQAREWSRTGAGGTKGQLRAMTGFYDRYGGHGTRAVCEQLLHSIGYPPEHVHIHEGWFQDTFTTSASQVESIALLRIDADWYAATRLCLETFYERVTPGGIVVIDDYGTYEGCRRAVDEYLSKHGPPPFLHHVSKDVRYLVKGT
jgi:O-methyltransferase